MAASDELRILVTAVIDYGFMKASEGGAGIGANVRDPQRFDDVDHKIGTGAIGRENFQRRRRAEFGFRRDWGHARARRGSCGLRVR